MTIIQSDPRASLMIRRIKRSAFFKRFTDAELEDIEFLSIDDTAATAAIRRQKARLRRILLVLATMEFIDLDDTRVRTWITLMETRGLIGAGRAVVILDAPVAIDEEV